MRVEQTSQGFALYKEKSQIGWVHVGQPPRRGLRLSMAGPRLAGPGLRLLPGQRGLRLWGGFDTSRATVFTAPAPTAPAEAALWAKFGFAAEGGRLVRRRKPDLSAVQLAQQFVAGHCPAPGLCIDATCGNGGDTAFLWQLVQAADVCWPWTSSRPPSCRPATSGKAGADPARCQLVQDSHENLLHHVQPGSADAIMFNFGWLPGADHQVHSQAGSSLTALQAALDALRPGGILSAVLYSGKVVGWDERDQVLAFFRSLPLTQ